MKYLFTLLVFLCIPQFVDAQRIHFTDTANVWTVISTSIANSGTPTQGYGSVFRLKIKTDTLVNGVAYKKMHLDTIISVIAGEVDGYVQPLPYLYREDTVQKKLWAKGSIYLSDTAEHLVYDGNWQIGDYTSFTWDWQPNLHSVIIGIDSIMINALWYKIFHFKNPLTQNCCFPQYFDVVEGIGCTNGPGFNYVPSYFENWSMLTCFSHHGITPPLNPPLTVSGSYLFDNTTSCTLATTNITQPINQFTIYPNPATDVVHINIPQGNAGTISITDVTGRMIAAKACSANDTQLSISTDMYAPGMYFVNYRNDGGVYLSSKLIIK